MTNKQIKLAELCQQIITADEWEYRVPQDVLEQAYLIGRNVPVAIAYDPNLGWCIIEMGTVPLMGYCQHVDAWNML